MKNTDFIRRIDAKIELVGLPDDLDAEAVQRDYCSRGERFEK